MPRDVFSGGSNVFDGDGDAGPLGNRPSATDVPDGFIWYATDDNGGTAYRSNGQVWVKLAPGVLETGGRELAYAEKIDANFSTSTTTATDILGCSINFTAGARPVAIRFGGSDMSHSVANTICVLQAVRTDTSAIVGYIRAAHPTANGRIPIASQQGRMSGLTQGQSYTVKLQTVFGTAGAITVYAGPGGPTGIWIQAIEL